MFQVSKQLNWWLQDLLLLSSVDLDFFGETSGIENWENGFAIGDANTKIVP